MRVGIPSILRIYVEARTAHLERAKADGAAIAYLRASYDFDHGLAEAVGAERIGVREAFLRVCSGKYEIVEVNEPLMLGAWPTLLAIAAAHAVSPRRTRSEIVSYAIENGDVVGWLSSKTHLPRPVAKRATKLVGRLVVSRLARLAFGTEAAEARYKAVLGRIPAETRLFTALEPACECLSTAPSSARSGVVFLGSFEPRKGLPELMAAWASINDPRTALTIIGKGPLEEDLRAWKKPEVRLIVDPDRSTIHEELRNATALVLLSQPAQRWQEQIGLPILEGLSHGCEIVTTDETGLAPWLRANGHRVLEAHASAESIGTEMRRAARRARRESDLLSKLPAESGRFLASSWLSEPHRPAGRGPR